MDFGIAGRTALISDDDFGRALRRALEAEGVTITHELGDAVDIVVAHDNAPTSREVLAVQSAEQLDAAWDVVVETIGAYRAALPAMAERGWGRFVWVGTAAAKALNADDDELGALTSMAVMALNKVIAAEAGPANVTANAVLRGGLATEDDMAAAVAFLCSEGAGYLTGVTITIDGGVGSAMY
jgi:3-oxoacyl-[acyl-carrier protein] reductase